MTITVAHVTPLVALIAGILILIVPRSLFTQLHLESLVEKIDKTIARV